ncbi:hypothetical protein Clacol_007528 [Clathrus columnatus]|uniref:Uncharacterized protein n=1 Tax=Clathrus columnatus TaxID=1419009 RepID=A0AAV5AF64_9AGAM|nr:hypothetical protein Clacol_007528 [Clathrus columnatus]
MLFNISFTALCWVLLVFKSHVDAAVLKRDVFDPPITYPTAGTVWQVGEIHNVTWNTAILPANFTGTGMIVLGFLNDTANDGNEHLDLANPLATGFPLSSGRVNVKVPSVPAMDSYILVLFGDSGNASPQFTISNLSIGTSPPPKPSSSSPSPPISAPPSSIVGGSGSTAEASSSLNSPSLTLLSASNSPVADSSSPIPSSVPAKTTSIAISTSLSENPTASSSSGSPSTPSSGSQNGVAENNNAARSNSPKKAISQSPNQAVSASQIVVKQSQVTMPSTAQVKRKNKLKAKAQVQSNDGKEKILGDVDYVTLMLGGRRKAKEEANKIIVDSS